MLHKVDTTIRVCKPFGLKSTVLGHGWHECAPISWCEAGACLQTIERVGAMPVRLSVTEISGRGRFARLRLTVEAEEVGDTLVTLMRERMCVMLRVDLDLDGFYALAADHPKLAPVVELGAGRLLRCSSMFENIIKAMCGTNVNWAQAIKMINRIGQLGPCLEDFRNLNAWPTAAEILSAGEDYLLGVARVGYRASSILEFCRSVQRGGFDAEGLDEMAGRVSTDELYEHLLTIKGIGPATASFLLGLLGHFDRLSVDSWTIAFVAQRYMGGRKPTVKEVKRLYDSYGRWRSLVWWFEQWLEWSTARAMLNGRAIGTGD